eukprot:1162028-Pelagomonas_calceolata.AAC.12
MRGRDAQQGVKVHRRVQDAQAGQRALSLKNRPLRGNRLPKEVAFKRPISYFIQAPKPHALVRLSCFGLNFMLWCDPHALVRLPCFDETPMLR